MNKALRDNFPLCLNHDSHDYGIKMIVSKSRKSLNQVNQGSDICQILIDKHSTKGGIYEQV
jgi:hypothetical protein